MSNNVFATGRSWANFKYLEDNVIECLHYIALNQRNQSVWSNRLGELLIRIGSAIDRCFNEARQSHLFDNEPGIQYLRRLSQPRINHYRAFYEPIYHLSEAAVDIKHDGVFFKQYCPFELFEKGQNPTWWAAYDHVKHDWNDSLENDGTLGNVVDALGGLFLLNVLHKDSQEKLIDEGIIFSPNLEKPHLIFQLKQSKIGIPINVDCQAMSRLCTHIFRKRDE